MFENCFRAPGTEILSFANNRVQSASSLLFAFTAEKNIECKSLHIFWPEKLLNADDAESWKHNSQKGTINMQIFPPKIY